MAMPLKEEKEGAKDALLNFVSINQS